MLGHIFPAFRKLDQPVRIDHCHPLATADNDPFFFPSAQQAADGMQRRAGHFGDVLARYRKVDLNAAGRFPPGLVHEAQQRMCDALLDLLGRHLDDAGLGFLKHAADRLVGIGAEHRKPGG